MKPRPSKQQSIPKRSFDQIKSSSRISRSSKVDSEISPQFSFSPLGSLTSFMNTRNVFKKPRLEERKPSLEAPSQSDEPTETHSLPTLTVPQVPLSEPRTIILKTTLLTTHPFLTHTLETHPYLTLIYRDPPNIISQPSTAIMPDIILSPTTCILLTSLSSTTNRPLPGQGTDTASSPLQNDLSSLLSSYPRIFLLTIFPAVPLSGTTCRQIAELQNLRVSLSSPLPQKGDTDQKSSKKLITPLLIAHVPASSFSSFHSSSSPPPATDPLTATILSLIAKHSTACQER